jgi:hypothetical protein
MPEQKKILVTGEVVDDSPSAEGPPPGIMQVTFVDKYPPYNAGETAGFTVNEAQALVQLGVAVPKGMEPDMLITNETSQNPEHNKVARVTVARLPEPAGQPVDVFGRPTGGLSNDALYDTLRDTTIPGDGDNMPRPDARFQNLRQLQGSEQAMVEAGSDQSEAVEAAGESAQEADQAVAKAAQDNQEAIEAGEKMAGDQEQRQTAATDKEREAATAEREAAAAAADRHQRAQQKVHEEKQSGADRAATKK